MTLPVLPNIRREPFSAEGPVATSFTLLFRPLWPVIVPATEWMRSSELSARSIPDTLLEPLRIWIMDCYPQGTLVEKLIELGDGLHLPERDPLDEKEWADPLWRASQMLWVRAAEVLSRPIPPAVLEEMSEVSGLRTTSIETLLPAIQLVFAGARHFFQSRKAVVPVVPDRDDLALLLKEAAGRGITAWCFALTLLMTSRNEIDIILPTARAVAHVQPDARLWLELCDHAITGVYELFTVRCDRISREVTRIRPAERAERRVLLWLEANEQATMHALIRFAGRCSVYGAVAAELMEAVAKAAKAQFSLLVEEDRLIAWPVTAWPDSLMISFETGNRRFRQLVSLGASFSRFADYRGGIEQLVAHYMDERITGLGVAEKIHACEMLEASSSPSSLLTDYLQLLPSPARGRIFVRRDVSLTMPWSASAR
ncbi:hypothetical protein [Acetobacter sp.]|jgi:hypothetical protein|uniref:hypothetical protein n=1 Tax=Acetobacter sp. TaxID=440 RepID=UPI0025BA3A11|nr:hypothetical protein [Acetobacter sp.]MCH4090643.1 hypothetical protein [Acetobacter sp.]MCI1300086.1 hypothetical protein [Acetobacter sp.]MCI1316504.1 hypothetical protein [Acetobacter sp.]